MHSSFNTGTKAMTDSKIVSLSEFRQGYDSEELTEAQAEVQPKRRKISFPWSLTWDVIRFGSLSGAAWMLYSHPMAMQEYGDLVWLLTWLGYAAIGAGLLMAGDSFLGFVLSILYFAAGVVLLFHVTWLGVVVLVPYAWRCLPCFSERVYVVRPF